jgi:single-stranded DNA-binding protein
MGQKKENHKFNSVTLVGFVGADLEQRQARSNGSKFTVLSVAMQRSWKNAQEEWSPKTEWHIVQMTSRKKLAVVGTSAEWLFKLPLVRFHITA